MVEEGKEAMTVAEIERIIETTEPREMSSTGDRVWTRRMAEALHGRLVTVERTIANEALRRAAEVAQGDFTDEPHFQPYASGRRDAADAILDLIKEPGHE